MLLNQLGGIDMGDKFQNSEIKKILMERDGVSESEAIEQIEEAIEIFNEYLESGDEESAHDICQECFGLEPDYIFEIMGY